MGFKQSVKTGFFSKYNVKRWFGMDEHVQNFDMLKNLYKATEVEKQESKAKASKGESFSECVQRLGLSEADLEARMRSKIRLVWAYLALGLLLFLYILYLVSVHQGYSALICSLLLLGLFLLSAKEHYSYFQIKRKQFGGAIKEWLSFLFHRDHQ